MEKKNPYGYDSLREMDIDEAAQAIWEHIAPEYNESAIPAYAQLNTVKMPGKLRKSITEKDYRNICEMIHQALQNTAGKIYKEGWILLNSDPVMDLVDISTEEDLSVWRMNYYYLLDHLSSSEGGCKDEGKVMAFGPKARFICIEQTFYDAYHYHEIKEYQEMLMHLAVRDYNKYRHGYSETKDEEEKYYGGHFREEEIEMAAQYIWEYIAPDFNESAIPEYHDLAIVNMPEELRNSLSKKDYRHIREMIRQALKNIKGEIHETPRGKWIYLNFDPVMDLVKIDTDEDLAYWRMNFYSHLSLIWDCCEDYYGQIMAFGIKGQIICAEHNFYNAYYFHTIRHLQRSLTQDAIRAYNRYKFNIPDKKYRFADD